MEKSIAVVVQIIVVMVGVGWALTLLHAQLTCSLIPSIGPHCTDGKGEVWMLPMFTAAIGIPALIASGVILVAAYIRRRTAP